MPEHGSRYCDTDNPSGHSVYNVWREYGENLIGIVL